MVDVSRRELEAMLQDLEETVTSFISRWRENVQMVDRPSKREHISMLMRSLQPKYARHLMGFSQIHIGALIEALYGIAEGISRGLCLILPLLTLRGRDHLERRDPEMLVLSVLLGRDHSGDFKLSPRLSEYIILRLMHSIRHLLPL